MALVVAVALGVAFGQWAFLPPRVDSQATAPATVVVTEVTVGRSVPMAVSAVWERAPFGVGAASGTVTTLDVVDADLVQAGQVLFTVDLRPVVAAVGEVPAFRDLAAGARGVDVKQVQQFLTGEGHFRGEANGHFGPATAGAVRAWQRSLGVPVDGVVRASDLLFAAELPARVVVAEGVGVGHRVADGEVLLYVLSDAPVFVAAPQVEKAVDASLPVEVTFDGAPVSAVMASMTRDERGHTQMMLTREDGAPVCGEMCHLVSLNPQEAVFAARQVVTAPVTGPGVPAAALRFDAAGSAYLLGAHGAPLPVTVVAQGDGQVVLDGVALGTIAVVAGKPGDR